MTVGPSPQTKTAMEGAAVHVRSAAAGIANLRAGETVHVFDMPELLGNLAANLASEVAERGKVPQAKLCQVLRTPLPDSCRDCSMTSCRNLGLLKAN